MARASRHIPFPCAAPPGATRPGNASLSSSLGEGVAGLILCLRSVRARFAPCEQPLGVRKTIPVWNSFAALCLHGRVPHWLNCCAIMNRRAGGGHVSEAQHSDSLVIGGFTP